MSEKADGLPDSTGSTPSLPRPGSTPSTTELAHARTSTPSAPLPPSSDEDGTSSPLPGSPPSLPALHGSSLPPNRDDPSAPELESDEDQPLLLAPDSERKT